MIVPKGEVKRLALQPGDIVVLELPAGTVLSRDQAGDIRRRMREEFPGHQVSLVIGEIKVIAPEKGGPGRVPDVH